MALGRTAARGRQSTSGALLQLPAPTSWLGLELGVTEPQGDAQRRGVGYGAPLTLWLKPPCFTEETEICLQYQMGRSSLVGSSCLDKRWTSGMLSTVSQPFVSLEAGLQTQKCLTRILGLQVCKDGGLWQMKLVVVNVECIEVVFQWAGCAHPWDLSLESSP